MKEKEFIESFQVLAKEAFDTIVSKGFYENPKADELEDIANKLDGSDAKLLKDVANDIRFNNDVRSIALMHSELSEAVEALREGEVPDSKLPQFLNLEVELADTLLRIMNYSHEKKLRVAEAVIAKMEYNKTRPYKHGGKKF
jgi:NTP pyrophosphatase (non-canonical NTP hydrolase)